MIHYIIQVLIFQTLFLAVYDLFLKKETFFQWNRAYLIATSILAYIIPLIEWSSFSTYVQNDLSMDIPAITLGNDSTYLNEVVIGELSSNFHFTTLEIIYLIGIVLTSLLFISKIIQIYSKIKKNTILKKKEYKLVLLSKQVTAFSFFRYLFLGKEIYKQEHQHIIDHELIHIKQKHSIDLLFFELQKILFWMNPFSYLYQNRISALHEFIADAKAIKINPKKQFFENLLNQTFQIEKFSFVNQFYKKSLIKKRIIMATKNKSKEILKLKYLLVLPVVLLMFAFASVFVNRDIKNQDVNLKLGDLNNLNNSYVTDTISPIKNQSNIHLGNLVSGKSKKRTTYKGEKLYNSQDIDEPTHFEKRISKSKRKGLEFIMDLLAFAWDNLDEEKIKSFNSKDKGAVITFIVNKQGRVEGIEASLIKNKAFKEYAINMVKKLPKIIPGKHQGKTVYTRGVIYISNYINHERVKLPYGKVDQKPIYPGCENEVNKDKCFQQSISKFIVKNFDQEMVNSLGLSNGLVKIVAQFSFNEYGNTLDVRVRAPHPKIKEHVKTIISKIPQVIPAKNNGENVVVKYTIPININIKKNNNTISQNSITEVCEVEEFEEQETIPFSVIDYVPIYPGCSGENHELKKCMSEKISKYVAQNFNVDLAQNLDLSAGKKRISVQFEIDKYGNIADVRARAPHPKLQEEAIRIIKLLPKMKPGMHHNTAVNVRYNLPIIFNVEEEDVEEVSFSVIEQAPMPSGCKGDNNKLKRCLSNYITNHVSANFNLSLAKNLGLKSGIKRISVQFKVDNNGYIVNITARAPHPKLQEEAIRVIKLLPKMKPGKQHGRDVNVRYSLPITFKVK